MSVHAGSILHIGGNNIIDRIQSAGLGDVTTPIETIREVGNRLIVDKQVGDPEYTFNIESLDSSTEWEAWLTGQVGIPASGSAPGATDPDGTEYKWEDCGFLNVVSPWADATTGDAGTIDGGHIIPGYYVTRVRYRFGVTDNATQEAELAGGQFYYGDAAPVEQFESGTGAVDTFVTDDIAVRHRRGGAGGTTFRWVFGVIVDGEIQIEGTDYTQSGASGGPDTTAEIVFTDPPANGADIRFTYFTTAAVAWPQARHASTVVKPAAVRGRNICIWLGSGASRQKFSGVQSFELEATVDGDPEREFCNEEQIGRSVTGRDTRGQIVFRPKNKDAFFDVLTKVTGVSRSEVIGFINQNPIPLEAQIQNPKNPAEILKTLYVDDAIFQVPGTAARVNTPTDFTMRYESQKGTFSAFKGAKP